MRLLRVLLTLAAVAPVSALAQTTAATPGATSAGTAAGTVAEDSGGVWAFSINAYAYLVPEDDDFLQPTVTADRGKLHLEARYNYEDFNTGSLWVGYNFSLDGEVTLTFTPMAAAVAGDTDGVAPGFNLAIDWWRLAFFSQCEYVFDSDGSEESFFYSWTELSVWPLDWLGAGVVVQRTKVADLDFEAEPGVLLGLAYKNADLTVYLFDLDGSDPVVVVGAGLSF
ncbi:MAG: hypothetical protein C3F15_10570 [Holophagae bacterium]|nr:MAG: hypothetical protein C3F15_10570 [Holophagae bacterium]